MTDKLHYLDLFTTINIPEIHNQFTLETKHLFDAIHGIETVVPGANAGDPNILTFQTKMTDTSEVAQLMWIFENTEEHTIDRLALTITFGRLAVGIEHRDRSHKTTEFRKSRIWGNVVYDYTSSARIPGGNRSECANASFENNFNTTTIANLGLASQIARLRDQSDSSEASLANAA